MLKIKSIKKSDPEQRISYQIVAEVMSSIMKSKDFCVRLEVSLEDKVYPETYYHPSQNDIQMDETPIKIHV
jgi:hypothetical protein